MCWMQLKSNNSEPDRGRPADNDPDLDHVLVQGHNPKRRFLLDDCNNRPNRTPGGILLWTDHSRLSVTDTESKVRIEFVGCSHHHHHEDQREVIASYRDCRATSWGSGHSGCCIHCLLQNEGRCYKSCCLVHHRIRAAALNCCRKGVDWGNKPRKKARRSEEVEIQAMQMKDPCKETGNCCYEILDKVDDGEEGEDLLGGTKCRTTGVGGIVGKDED